MQNLMDLLKAARPNDKPPHLVLNQVGIPKRPEIAPADFAKALGITPLAVIPHDPQSFGLAQGNGQMIFEVAPKAKATEILGQLANHLAGNRSAAAAKVKGGSFLSKLPMLKKKSA